MESRRLPAANDPSPGSPSELDRAEIDALLEASGHASFVLGRDGRYLKIGAGGHERLFRPASELLGKTLHDVFPAADAKRFLDVVQRVIDSQTVEHLGYSLRIGGKTVWFSGTAIPTAEGTVLWVARDISEQHLAHEALRANEAAHRDLLASLPVIVYCVEPTPPYAPIFVSPGTNDLGYSSAEWRGPLWFNILHPDDRDRIIAETEAALAAQRPVEYEYRVIAKDGSVRWMHDRGAFVQDENGRTVAWRGVMLDVTERRALEERLAALSETDELTGLLNRRGFRRMAEHTLKVERRSGRRAALFCIDVDHLKPINDRFGHPEGDRALRAVADVLRSALRDGDVMARFGGDEFVVLAPAIGLAGESDRLVQRLRDRLGEENARARRPYVLTFSVGVVEETGATDLDRFIERADAMLYAQKVPRTS